MRIIFALLFCSSVFAGQSDLDQQMVNLIANQTNGAQKCEITAMPAVEINTAGLCTSAKQDTQIGHLSDLVDLLTGSVSVTGVFWQATQPVSGSVNVSNFPASFSVSNFPASQAVTGSFYQATQPVSGTFWQATQPISGTVTANAGSGTLAVSGPLTDSQLRNSAVPVSGTFYQATQPISAASLPLPTNAATSAKQDTGNTSLSSIDGKITAVNTGAVVVSSSALPSGASTAAKQPALGTAGSASADVISVQGIASMTALKVDGSGVTQPVSGTFWQATQPISGTIAATQSGTWTVQPGNTANTTAWKVDGSAVTQPVSGTFYQATQPVSGTVAATQSGTWNVGSVTTLPALPANQSVNVAQINGVTTLMGAGNTGTGSQRVTIATDQVAIPVSQSGTWNIGTITTLPALVASSAAIGKLSANSGVDIGDVDVTSIAAGTNRLGSVRVVDSGDADLTSLKGTQTARAVGIQELKDAGRVALRFYAVAAAAGTTTTETAITLTKSSDNAATSTGTSFVPTSGKRFRITAFSVATRGHSTATIQTTTFNLRVNTAGAVTTSSTPIELAARSATPATASAWDRIIIPVPDGWEILGDGTLQWGITAAATYTTNAPTWDVTLVGYEY